MYSTEKSLSADTWFTSDQRFLQLYPDTCKVLAKRHWTPLNIAKSAAAFLAAEKNTRILDIGSGIGSFCLTAAFHNPDARFFGIEQRLDLVEHAENANNTLQLENVEFMQGNFVELDLKQYNHFYFFNSFYENLSGTPKIDENLTFSQDLFHYYNRNLYKQLGQMPSGTRLATYHSVEDEIPGGYHVVGSDTENLLKFWVKI